MAHELTIAALRPLADASGQFYSSFKVGAALERAGLPRDAAWQALLAGALQWGESEAGTFGHLRYRLPEGRAA